MSRSLPERGHHRGVADALAGLALVGWMLAYVWVWELVRTGRLP